MKKLLMFERGASQSTMDMFFPKGEVTVLKETDDFYLISKKGFMGKWFIEQWLPKNGIIVKFQEIKESLNHADKVDNG